MIDTLLRHLPMADARSRAQPLAGAGAAATPCSRCIGRRTSTTADTFAGILEARRSDRARHAGRVSGASAHARAAGGVRHRSIYCNGVTLTEPLGYIDFLSLTSHARLVLTDSGGLQEESTALGIPCLTLRENTERPVTVTHGTNRVVGTKTGNIVAGYQAAMQHEGRFPIPPLWDGRASERVAQAIDGFLR